MTTSRIGLFEDPIVAPGWSLSRVVPSTKLLGANGIRFGPDGRLFVAQALGSQISAVDKDSGASETIVPVNGGVAEPDDLAFDSRGTLYMTEVMEGRVSARDSNGHITVIADSIPAANGISVHGDRIFVDECRVNGRLLELFADGRRPRVIAENLPTPNALCLGPDENIYFPTLRSGEVWRVPCAGGRPERFLDGLSVPIAVKFNSRGELIVAVAATGDLMIADIQSSVTRRIGHTRPGIDNIVLDDTDRLFVSHVLDGGISEISKDGSERTLVSAGMMGPWGLTIDANGAIFAADVVSIARIDQDGTLSRVGAFVTDHNFPGFARNIIVGPNGVLYVADSGGNIWAYKPQLESKCFASGLGQIMGMERMRGGAMAVCDYDGGRLLCVSPEVTTTLAVGLGRPTGVTLAADGGFFVAEAKAGRVLYVKSGEISTVIDGLIEPHGILRCGDNLFVIDRSDKSLRQISLSSNACAIVAKNLPVGSPPGVTMRTMPGIHGLIPGPILPFTGLTVDAQGKLYVAADGEGSIITLEQKRVRSALG